MDNKQRITRRTFLLRTSAFALRTVISTKVVSHSTARGIGLAQEAPLRERV